MTKDEIKQIKAILRNLINSELKAKESPCSSATHFYSAVYGLTKLIPEFNTTMYVEPWHSDENKKEILELFKIAKEVTESYSPLRH